jgi:hypothetical protein
MNIPLKVKLRLFCEFQIVSETVDIVSEHRIFPHERFALRRMVAGTLTSNTDSEIGLI